MSEILSVQESCHETMLSRKSYLERSSDESLLVQLKFEEVFLQLLQSNSSNEILSYFQALYSKSLFKFKDLFESHTFENVEDMIAQSKLISLLKEQDSTLIIIEATDKLSLANTWKLIKSFKTLWQYKGLLLWAKARENKAIDRQLFEALEDIKVSHEYYLEGMVCVSYIRGIAMEIEKFE